MLVYWDINMFYLVFSVLEFEIAIKQKRPEMFRAFSVL